MFRIKHMPLCWAELMQQHWISATEDSALVIEKSSLRQAADLHGRDCREKWTGWGKGHKLWKKREMGVGKCYQRIKVNSGYIALTGTSFGGRGGLFSPKTKPRLLRLKLGFSLVCWIHLCSAVDINVCGSWAAFQNLTHKLLIRPADSDSRGFSFPEDPQRPHSPSLSCHKPSHQWVNLFWRDVWG